LDDVSLARKENGFRSSGLVVVAPREQRYVMYELAKEEDML
jgi:hypothetical protein